ncbi:hypothetical protein HK102_013088, partial [Quaeritorhiza haematococci]
DDRPHRRQFGGRRAVPGLQPERPRGRPDDLLGPARRLVLPPARGDRRVGGGLPGLRPRESPGLSDAPAGRFVLRSGRIHADGRDPQRPGHRQAAQAVQAEGGRVRARRLGADRPLSADGARPRSLHQRTVGSEPLDSQPFHHRPRLQLAHQPVPEIHVHLGAFRVRPAGLHQRRPVEQDQRPVPGPHAALLL